MMVTILEDRKKLGQGGGGVLRGGGGGWPRVRRGHLTKKRSYVGERAWL